MRRILSLLFALVLGLTMTATAVPSADAVQAYCGITWGSLPKAYRTTTLSTAPLTNIRSGSHLCYDRLVLDLAGAPGGYSVKYVDVVRGPGSGDPVALRGGAAIEIVANNPAHDENGRATLVLRNRAEAANVSGFHTFRQVVFAGSFEGHTTIALGVRARLPFRVFTLDGPGSGSRLVLDVARYW